MTTREDLGTFVGATSASIARLFYVFDGTAREDRGPVEITFTDGRFVGLDVGGDGESLRLDDKPWDDPFLDPLSAENAEFVARSGKWTRFDLSAVEPYAHLIGSWVTDVVPVVHRIEKLTGVVVVTSGGSLEVECDADDVWVTLTHTR
jgi:hypothetical protein